MDMLYTIGITLATLAILVAVHEYGHFWVARRCGVKVLRFSIGFGPSLLRWRDQLDTEYCIAAIPLGGYVKMLDEREGEVPAAELEQAFNRKPVLQRIAVVSAGPLANFLLAIAVYWGLFMAGESGYAPLIGEVEAGLGGRCRGPGGRAGDRGGGWCRNTHLAGAQFSPAGPYRRYRHVFLSR